MSSPSIPPAAGLRAGPLALIESASAQGVEARRRLLRESGSFDLGWSYANILQAVPRLSALLAERGFFRLYLHLPGAGGSGEEGRVTHAMRVTGLAAFERPEMHSDLADGRSYLVHSKMTVSAIEELSPPRPLSSFSSADGRHMDLRHLTLGFLFVVDPEG